MPVSVDRFPNKVAPNVPYNILRNPLFCSFASFLIFSVTSFINQPDSSRNSIIFIIPFISSFEIINVVCFAKSEGHIQIQTFSSE